METAIYTHDEKGHRIDIHAPRFINPGDYEYVKVAELRRAKQDHEKVAGPSGTCHHCGKAIVWTVYYRHLPTGNLVTFGYQCSEILDMTDNRIDHEMNLLKRRAANERKEEQMKMQKQEREEQFRARFPEVAKFLDEIDDTEQMYFLKSVKGSLERWGSLTDPQANAVQKIMKKREEYMARKIQEAIEHADDPEPEPLEEGRYVIEGVVLKDEWKVNAFGERHVMTVKMDDGNKVWGTVPRDIAYSAKLQGDDPLKGHRVRFTARVEKSDRDEHFGFFSKPTKGEVL